MNKTTPVASFRRQPHTLVTHSGIENPLTCQPMGNYAAKDF